MLKIETPEDFCTIRDTLSPVTLKGKRRTINIPCMHTLLVNRGLIRANNYNPNSVAKDKMRLLLQSVIDNGFCFPVVCIWDDSEQYFVIVDGFHRFTITGPQWLGLPMVPIVWVPHDITQRMYATVQFNKARGVHQVELDADLIRALLEQGNTEEEVSVHLGIDIDTIHRYKQLTGIAALFANTPYSMPWTMEDVENG